MNRRIDLGFRRTAWTFVIAVAAACTSGLTGADSTLYVLRDLGTLGGPESMALAMNNSGQVVGWAETDHEVPQTHAFLWEKGGMTDLQTLGGNSSEARDINDRGQIVGVSETRGGERHGFYWVDGRMFDLNDIVVDLTDEPPDTGTSRMSTCEVPLRLIFEANGIGPDGSIVGCAEFWGDDAVHGFVLVPDRPRVLKTTYTYVDLGMLPGTRDCFAIGVTEGPWVVGRSGDSPFVWKNGVMEGLEDMTRTVIPTGTANVINDLGVVAGYTGEGWVTGPKACFWSKGIRHDLMSGPGVIGKALDLNRSGQIVGWQTIWDSIPSAMLWDGGCVAIDLNEVTAIPIGTTPFQWLRLSEATAIDADRRIAGFGIAHNGRTHAFLLRPYVPVIGE